MYAFYLIPNPQQKYSQILNTTRFFFSLVSFFPPLHLICSFLSLKSTSKIVNDARTNRIGILVWMNWSRKTLTVVPKQSYKIVEMNENRCEWWKIFAKSYIKCEILFTVLFLMCTTLWMMNRRSFEIFEWHDKYSSIRRDLCDFMFY